MNVIVEKIVIERWLDVLKTKRNQTMELKYYLKKKYYLIIMNSFSFFLSPPYKEYKSLTPWLNSDQDLSIG